MSPAAWADAGLNNEPATSPPPRTAPVMLLLFKKFGLLVLPLKTLLPILRISLFFCGFTVPNFCIYLPVSSIRLENLLTNSGTALFAFATSASPNASNTFFHLLATT